MTRDEDAGLLEIQVSRVVRAAVSPHERWPGELKASALADALVLDMRQAGVAPGGEHELQSEQIVNAARKLVHALEGKGDGFALPFGTLVEVGRPGSVVVAGRVYVRRVRVPGLHPAETVPRDARGANLESLRLMVGSRSSSSSAERFGLPTPALIGVGGAVRHLIELAPLPELAGAVLQFGFDEFDAARFCAAPTLSLERFANRIVKAAQWLWRHRVAIAKRVEAARRAAEAGIDAARRCIGSPVLERVCIEGSSVGRPGGPDLILRYLGLDDALRLGALVDVVPGQSDLEGAALLAAPLAQGRRAIHRQQLWAYGADGRIDRDAAAVAGIAPEGTAAVLQRLSSSLETVVVLPTPSGGRHVTLFWREGVIRAEATRADGLTLWEGEVDAGDGFDAGPTDETTSNVLELGYVEHWAIVGEERLPGRRLRQRLKDATAFVNTATGAIWTDPGLNVG